MAIDPVTVEFGAKTDDLIKGVDASKGIIESLDSSVSKLSSSFGVLGSTIALAFSIGALEAFGSKMGEIADASGLAAQKLGITPEEASAMSAGASVAGSSLNDFVAIFTKLDETLNNTDPFSRASQAIKILGINAKEVAALPIPQQMGAIADAVAKLGTGIDRTAAVTALGGDQFAKLLPLLDQGKKAFVDLAADVAKSGAIMEGADQTMASDFGRTMALLKLYTVGIGNDLWHEIGPALTNIGQAFLTMAQDMRDSYKEGGATKIMFDLIGEAARAGALGVASLSQLVQALGVSIYGAYEIAAGRGKEAAAYVTGELERLGREWLKYRDMIYSDAPLKITVGPKNRPDADAINDNLKAEIAAKAAALQAEVALQKGYQTQLEALYSRDADMNQITNMQKLQLTRQATLDSYNVENQAALDKRNLYPENTKQWELAEKQRQMISQNAATAIIKIDADMMRDVKAHWDEVFGGLQSAFNGQLRGLLAGTTSFRDAFKAVLGDMIIFFIQMVEKMVFQWAAGKLAMAAIDQTDITKAVATQVAMSEATLPGRVASFMSNLTAAAGLAFANTFASLAIFGPEVAAPAAAAAEATVMAQSAAVPKYELGTDYVPRTGLAMVHQGEKITPAGQNSSGQNINVNISAVDSRSFVNLVNANPNAFANMIKRAMRDGMLPVGG